MIRNATLDVAPHDAGKRLDLFLIEQWPSTSRPLVVRAVAQNGIWINGRPAAKGRRLSAGDRVRVLALMERADWKAVPNPALPLGILHTDPDFLVLEKPSGMAVHPLDPAETGTVVNALLARHPELAGLGPDPLFPAIVHRLDTDTSGLLLAARNETSYRFLRREFQLRRVEKRYTALVTGRITHAGRLDQKLAHAEGKSHRMRVVQENDGGRRPMRAVTEYEPRQQLPGFTLLDVRIRTGVTHQIRCQMASWGHPVVGDALYGAPAGHSGRLFLHASEIAFRHPRTGAVCRFRSPLPADLKQALAQLV